MARRWIYRRGLGMDVQSNTFPGFMMSILLFRWHDSYSVIVLLEDADQASPIPLSSELFAVKSHDLSIPTLAASY